MIDCLGRIWQNLARVREENMPPKPERVFPVRGAGDSPTFSRTRAHRGRRTRSRAPAGRGRAVTRG